MAVIIFKNAFVFFNGLESEAAIHDLTVSQQAEMLDNTVFGVSTRRKQTGLQTDSVSGKAFFDPAIGVESVLFRQVGGADLTAVAVNPLLQAGAALADTAALVFPDGITEGAANVGTGFALKGQFDKFDIGGTVGALLDVTFSVVKSAES